MRAWTALRSWVIASGASTFAEGRAAIAGEWTRQDHGDDRPELVGADRVKQREAEKKIGLASGRDGLRVQSHRQPDPAGRADAEPPGGLVDELVQTRSTRAFELEAARSSVRPAERAYDLGNFHRVGHREHGREECDEGRSHRRNE